MLAEIKEQMPSLAAAVVVSILAGIIMYALGYSALMYTEVLLLLETLMYVVQAGYSALKAIFLGIVVFGLLLAFLLPILMVLWRQIQKRKRTVLSDASGPTPQPSSGATDATTDAYTFAPQSPQDSGSPPLTEAPDHQADASVDKRPHQRPD
ncbi:hypothetical protein [Nitrobacter sp.]|uniref:hypothetical protein n=1 Tax=Nitrobacter sp. TaxID=29420 RepID=UPI0029CAAE1B|nr:hypothetical protein [Nitrobacter sp.]